MRIIFKLFFLNNLITFNIQHISVNIIVNLVFTTLKITMSILLYKKISYIYHIHVWQTRSNILMGVK